MKHSWFVFPFIGSYFPVSTNRCIFRRCLKLFSSFFLSRPYHILSVCRLPNSISSPLFLWLPMYLRSDSNSLYPKFNSFSYPNSLLLQCYPFQWMVTPFTKMMKSDIWKMVLFFTLTSTAYQFPRPINSTSYLSHKSIQFFSTSTITALFQNIFSRTTTAASNLALPLTVLTPSWGALYFSIVLFEYKFNHIHSNT